MVKGRRYKDKPTNQKPAQPLSCPETNGHSAAREMDSEGQKEGNRENEGVEESGVCPRRARGTWGAGEAKELPESVRVRAPHQTIAIQSEATGHCH